MADLWHAGAWVEACDDVSPPYVSLQPHQVNRDMVSDTRSCVHWRHYHRHLNASSSVRRGCSVVTHSRPSVLGSRTNLVCSLLDSLILVLSSCMWPAFVVLPLGTKDSLLRTQKTDNAFVSKCRSHSQAFCERLKVPFGQRLLITCI